MSGTACMDALHERKAVAGIATGAQFEEPAEIDLFVRNGSPARARHTTTHASSRQAAWPREEHHRAHCVNDIK